MARIRITAGSLEALKAGETIYDDLVLGFGARRQTATGDVTFHFKAKLKGTQRQIFVAIGKYRRGDWTIAEARAKATELRHAAKRGVDPTAEAKAARAAMTVSELCDAYLAAAPELLLRAGRAKKESTLVTDQSRIDAHIKPLLGQRAVAEVTSADIETFLHRVAAGETAKPRGRGRGNPATGGKGTASRTVGLLGAIFTYAVKRKLRADNPVRGVVRYQDQRKERRLSENEYWLLGDALTKIEARNAVAVACIRFLALTGWRSGEAVNLKWTEIDRERRTATLGDTKTGRSMRPLGHAAITVLEAAPRRSDSPYVFPAATGTGPIGSLPRSFQRARDLAGLGNDVTAHTLRHSAASIASDLGLSEATIAALLGHRLGTITSRYIHAADATLLAAADKVADEVARMMGREKRNSEVVPMRR